MFQTPLHSRHLRSGATMTTFAGWDMPLQFSGLLEEHRSVRTAAGLFDVSHMGKILVAGQGAAAAIDALSPNRVHARPGRCVYTHLCDDDARILDDVIFTTLSPDAVFAVCNAGPRARVVAWLHDRLDIHEVVDVTEDLLCLAVQGPRALALLARAFEGDPIAARPFRAFPTRWRDGKPPVETAGWEALADALADPRSPTDVTLLTRTGYTGEPGAEVFPHRAHAERVWDGLLALGQDEGLRACGLGARDTLRLEKGYLLSGQDFDGTRTTLEAGYDWIMKWDHPFVGKAALKAQKDQGDYARLRGIRLEDRGVPRPGCEVLVDGAAVGRLTSGTMSPSLRTGIGLAYLPSSIAAGDRVAVRVRGRELTAVVVDTPFL